MKKTISLCLAFVMILGLLIVPVSANAAVQSFNLELGKTYTNTVPASTTLYGMVIESHSHVYTFALNQSSNIKVEITSEGTSQYWSLRSSDYSFSTSSQKSSNTSVWYLPKDKTYNLSISGAGKYTLKVSKADADKISIKSKSCKLKGGTPKTVPFTFTGTSGYAKDNLKVKSSNPKVATVDFSITSANAGTFTITPKYIGKTVITLAMTGGNSVKYTVYGVKGYWFVAKGTKSKAPKPSGVKNPKWSSSKKKTATINKKTGKITAKKGGRVTLTAKKGKVSYKLSTVVTDYIKLGKRTYKELKNIVNNPEKLKIYNVYKGFSKQIDSQFKIPVVVVDYGSTNENGAMVRNKIMAYYDDVYEARFTNGWSIDNIISRKNIKPSKIK